MNPKKVVFIGMGAIGSLYASKCSQTKSNITCITRSDSSEIKQGGIRIIHPNGQESTWRPDQVCESIHDVESPPDYVVIATKVPSNQTLVTAISPIIGPNTTIVLLQNGIFIESIYQEHYPETPIISGLAFVCVAKIAPATIHHQDYGRLVLGLYPNGNHQQVNDFLDLFSDAGIQCKLSSKIQFERYKKLIWNAPFNPLSVIYGGKTTQELLANDDIKIRIKNSMKDIQLLAAYDGYTIEDDILEKNITDTQKMKPYKTSMCLDWELNREIEIEAILGNAITRAGQLGCQVPTLKALYHELSIKIKHNK
tara:strand:- start:2397 stop:3326 length:930 start_codon:yes stop_codon:yes gene_type:complete